MLDPETQIRILQGTPGNAFETFFETFQRIRADVQMKGRLQTCRRMTDSPIFL